jgi:hypothetical protein
MYEHAPASFGGLPQKFTCVGERGEKSVLPLREVDMVVRRRRGRESGRGCRHRDPCGGKREKVCDVQVEEKCLSLRGVRREVTATDG